MTFLYRLIRLSAFACLITFAAEQAAACTCGSNIHTKNSWEQAKLEAQGATVIFEGTPERREVHWGVLTEKEGELIPADAPVGSGANWPRMVVTFRVQRAYKGSLGQEVKINTGFGGGDCGARLPPGLTYLIYAYGPMSDLSISMCSPGGWIGSDNVATQLRYLRQGSPTLSDLETIRHPRTSESPEERRERQRRYEEFEKRYAAFTGKICGTVTREGARDQNPGFLLFLSSTGYSPVANPRAEIHQDGTYCSEALGPGKYYLFFTKASENRITSATYYPGVNNLREATAVEVAQGQTVTNVRFKIPAQGTYSVRCLISIDDKSELKNKRVFIGLVRSDGGSREGWYSQTVNFDTFFPLPKVKYFAFDDVLPGDYIAFASVDGEGWFTKKTVVSVSTHTKFIFLELIHKK